MSRKWTRVITTKRIIHDTGTDVCAYNSSVERVSKTIEKGNITEECYYHGGYEVYRKTVSGGIETERTSLYVMDGNKTIAQIDDNGTTQTIRYQYDNLLGSASLELDENAGIISYEEYHPFGTTSYRSGRSLTEVSLKRYKYVGKERDDETGLYYYGARYYAAWLCRFVSVDPLQFDYPELTPFQYASNRPITGIDLDGLEFVDSNDALIEAGGSGIFWNSDNISTPLRNSISEKKMIRKTKYGSLEWSGEIRLHTQIKTFNYTKFRKTYETVIKGYGAANKNSETLNPQYYNSTPVAKSTGQYDKRFNVRYSPVWWNNPLKGGAMAAIIMATKEALNITLTAYSNKKIKEDVETAQGQMYLLLNSMNLYYNAEQSGMIPDEMQQSPNYQRATTDIINVIFSGEAHNFNGSLNYKDDNDNWQIISGENYQQMVLDFGKFIFNINKIDCVSENNNSNLEPVNKITFDITIYKDKK